jgi:hypothetical protein
VATKSMTTYRNGRRQRHSEDPARWREDPRAANGAAQLILRSVCRPRTARPADLARLEAAVRRISTVARPRGRSGRRYVTAGAAAVAMLGALGAASRTASTLPAPWPAFGIMAMHPRRRRRS